MRNKIWNNMSNIKFKAIYLDECARRANALNNFLSFLFAIISTSSVASWAFWKQYPFIWALLIASSQILQVAKGFIPFIKNERDFIEMSTEFEHLFLEYDKLWNAYEKNSPDVNFEDLYYRLRSKEVDIETAHKSLFCPEIKGLMKKSEKMVYSIFAIHFN